MTARMSGKSKYVIIAIASLLLTGSAFGRDYYVAPYGSNYFPGSSSLPWKTIQYASTRAAAGDTVHVLPGTYNESVQVISAGGTASAPIIFKSEYRWQAQVRGVGTLPAFQVRSGDYIGVVGFDVSGGGTQGIEIYTSNTKIIGNRVHDIPGGCPTYGGAGISVSILTSHDNLVDGNVVYNIRNDSGPCLLVHGIYSSNIRTVITNNVVFHTQGWGIHLWHGATHATIANNTVFNNDAGGIIVGAVASEVADGTGLDDYTVVTNNLVAYNGSVDGRFGIYENGATGLHNLYANNLVWHNLPAEGYLQYGQVSGIIWKDPLFVNYQPDGTGDYHLQSTSPAIDAGVASFPTASAINSGISPDHDIEGVARPQHSKWDIGAFEFH